MVAPIEDALNVLLVKSSQSPRDQHTDSTSWSRCDDSDRVTSAIIEVSAPSPSTPITAHD